MQDIFIQSKVVDIFPKFKMAAAAILDLQFIWIWPFQRVGSVVFVFWTKFGSNICYSHWDRRTYPSDLHLMTSRELTSGFDFWSRGHLRVAVVHLPIWFDARYLYPVQSYWHFSKIKDGGRRHLGFSIYVNLAIPALIVYYLCSVPNLVQMSVIVTEIDAHMLQTFIWWRHAN